MMGTTANLTKGSNDSVFLLESRGVSIAYGGKPALRNVSLRFRPGEITAIIGPSGCGKSSFLQTLNRINDLIPGCTVTGDVFLNGSSIYDRRIDLIQLRRSVGMIFQKPNPFPLSIRSNLELPLREKGIRNLQQREEIVERVLREVGLWEEVWDRLESSAMGLSGGQQQRLCIARALTLDPEVLLFDEPCSALDPIASRTVEELIGSLASRATVVIATHNLAQARRMAHHVAMFWYEDGAGTLVESGSAESILNSPQHPITSAYVRGAEG